MSIPEVFFRETIDLNRFSNKVAKEYAITYNKIIISAAKQLKQINIAQAKAGEAVIVAPQTRKRLRAIIKQAKDSLNTWSKASAKDFKGQLQGVALLQRDFIVDELKKVTASGNIPINSVAISPKYAESVIYTDPTQVNIFTSSKFTEDDFINFGSGKFELTARQGAAITLPNGDTIEKAFRGIAVGQQQKLALAIRSGVFSGQTTQQIARRLVGKLEFESARSMGKQTVKRLANRGGESIKLANYQVQTIVRTSVNQVRNEASQAVYAANKKVAPRYEYVATLDSRTSPICQRLDGREFAYNKGPTPPQHFNCRSTTVPVVDFDGLQKEYPGLEKPPETFLDTRPSITGRVPQNQAYGDWLLNQDEELQIKTLGSLDRVRFFRRLARKKGSTGQTAIRQLIRNDGTELSLEQLEKKYGKLRKPKVTAESLLKELKDLPPVPKEKPFTSIATGVFDTKKAAEYTAKFGGTEKMISDSLTSLESVGGLTAANSKKMRKFLKKTKQINNFAMRDERWNVNQIGRYSKKAIKDQLKTTEKAFDVFQTAADNREQAEYFSAVKEAIKQGEGKNFERVMRNMLKPCGKGYSGYTTTTSSVVNTKLYEVAKPLNKTDIKNFIKQKKSILNPELRGNSTKYVFRNVEVPSTTSIHDRDVSWFSTMVHEIGHQVHFKGSGASSFTGARGDFKFVSTYARKNRFEQFAEAFTMYIFDPEGLQTKAPSLYKWVDDNLNSALKLL